MKLDEVIRASLLAWLRRRVDPRAKQVTGWGPDAITGGDCTRIYYTHSGPTRDIRTFLYHDDWHSMLEQIDFDLTEES